MPTIAELVDAGLIDRNRLEDPATRAAAAESSDPIATFAAQTQASSPVALLQAAGGNPSLQLGIIGRFGIEGAGGMTFGAPLPGRRWRTPLVVGAAEVLSSGLGGARFSGPPPRQLTWQDPQVNFPRGIDRIYVPGTEPPPANRLPVPYERPPQPGPFAFGIGGISAVLGGIIGAIFESNMPGIGDLPDWFPNQLGREEGPFDTRAPAGAPEVILSGPGIPDVAAGPVDVFGPPSTAGDNPPAVPFPDFGGGPGQDALPEDIGIGPVPDPGPPQGARQAPPAPATTTARRVPPWVWPAIGTLGALQLGRRSRSSMTVPVSPIVPVGIDLGGLEQLLADAASSPAPSSTSSTMFLTQSSGAFDYGDDPCNCSSKKRGKKRKCLAWGQLSWRSGPKKGRPAGRRCIRFAN